MPSLKLTKLPDRKPVRMTITVSPDLKRALDRYAILYRDAYGEAESVATLIPFMLESFLESDRAFAKALKSAGAGKDAQSEPKVPRGRRGRGGLSPSTEGEQQCP